MRAAEFIIFFDQQGVEVALGRHFVAQLHGIRAGFRRCARFQLGQFRLYIFTFLERGLAAEGGRLDHMLAIVDVHQLEAPSDDAAVAEQALDLARVRARGDVKVFRPAAHQEIAHAAAHEVGIKAGPRKARHNAQGIGIERRLVDRVGGDNPRGGRLRVLVGTHAGSGFEPNNLQGANVQRYSHLASAPLSPHPWASILSALHERHGKASSS